MACFWNGILRALRRDPEGQRRMGSPRTPTQLVEAFHQRNVATEGLRWQGEELQQEQLRENVEWVRDYDARLVTQGHLTSACDPFLCLLAHVCACRVEHVYDRHTIVYEPARSVLARTVYHFRSSRSHFQ